jgi:predicted Zn-dependent protease
MEQIDLALKLDPRNPLLKSLYAIDLLLVHRYNDAVTAAHNAVQVDPTNPVGLCALVQGLHLTGNF